MDKAPDAFRTISEVADDLDVPQHVLRFWESRFTQIKPMKRGGGRRYYRPDDVALLRGIRHLLYGQGYTIRGVQRILREQGLRFVQTVWEAGAEQPEPAAEDEVETAAPALEASPREAEEARGLFGIRRSRELDAGEPDRPAAPLFERREPVLAAPAEPAGKPEPSSAGRRLALDDADRTRLQGVIDELAQCRRLLDAALEEPA